MSPSTATAAECSNWFHLQNAADLEVFLADPSTPKPREVAIDGRDLYGALTSEYVLRIVSTDHTCLKHITLVAGASNPPKILKLKSGANGFIRLVDLALHGERSLIDLSRTRAYTRINRSLFSRSNACLVIRKDSRIVIRNSTIFECGIKKEGKGRKRPIRMNFVRNEVFLTSVESLGSFLALRMRAGGIRPQLIYKYNTFYVSHEKHKQRLLEMLESGNIRCVRNVIVVFGAADEMNNRCAKVIEAKEEHRARRAENELTLGSIERTDWNLEQVVPPGKGDDPADGGDDGGDDGEEPSQPIGRPFADNTFFADGTGWIDRSSTMMACSDC